jgi:hypothetical protein
MRSILRIFLCLLVFVCVLFQLCSMLRNDDNLVNRSDTPVSYYQVQDQTATGVKLPPSATNCYYIDADTGFQSVDRYIRFNIPPQEADAAAAYILTHNHYSFSKQTLALKAPITTATSVDAVDAHFGSPIWWKNPVITHGYFVPHVDQEDFAIWYDADKSLIYVHYYR